MFSVNLVEHVELRVRPNVSKDVLHPQDLEYGVKKHAASNKFNHQNFKMVAMDNPEFMSIDL
jgi:hypothetical protein